jgi:hypothetical protein
LSEATDAQFKVKMAAANKTVEIDNLFIRCVIAVSFGASKPFCYDDHLKILWLA